MGELERTPEPFLITPRPADEVERYFARQHNRPVTLLDDIDDEATQVYIVQAQRIVARMQENPETRPQGIIATLSAFVDAVWQAVFSGPAAGSAPDTRPRASAT